MALERWVGTRSPGVLRHVPENRHHASVAKCPPCVWCSGSQTEILAACVDTLQATGLFAGLAQPVIAKIARECEVIRVEARRTLFEEGEPCDGLWILAQGRVRMYHVDPGGRQFIMAFRNAGSALLLAPALDGGAFSLSADVLDDSLLLLLPAAVLQEALQSQPLFARNIVSTLCLMLRRRNVAATTREFFDAASRVRCALVQFAYQYGVTSETRRRVNYRLTRQDIADYVGVTVETAIRVLSQMQHDGVLTSGSKLIEISDFAGFTKANGCAVCQFACQSIFGSSAPRDGG